MFFNSQGKKIKKKIHTAPQFKEVESSRFTEFNFEIGTTSISRQDRISSVDEVI